MAADDIKKAAWYLKDTQDIAMFSSMADSRLMLALRASPVFYIMLPFIGFLLTVIAGMNAYSLYKSNNKNLDLWLEFVSSTLSAGFASASLYGTALSVIMGFSYPLGPWFFLSSLIVGLIHQSIMMGVNFSRAFSAPKDSVQRMHYLQSALKGIYVIAALSAGISTVMFVMLFPTIAPVAGVVSAVSIAALTLLGVQWRVIPPNWKRTIKNFFHIGKPPLVQQNTSPNDVNGLDAQVADTPSQNYNRLFHFDYSARVRELDIATAKAYLQRLIFQKIASYGDVSIDESKSTHKLALLNELLLVLDDSSRMRSKKDLLSTYPLAFQSFWAEKGEVEQLFDAVASYVEKEELYKEAEIKSCTL